jgi:hypothetical protein
MNLREAAEADEFEDVNMCLRLRSGATRGASILPIDQLANGVPCRTLRGSAVIGFSDR